MSFWLKGYDKLTIELQKLLKTHSKDSLEVKKLKKRINYFYNRLTKEDFEQIEKDLRGMYEDNSRKDYDNDYVKFLGNVGYPGKICW